MNVNDSVHSGKNVIVELWDWDNYFKFGNDHFR